MKSVTFLILFLSVLGQLSCATVPDGRGVKNPSGEIQEDEKYRCAALIPDQFGLVSVDVQVNDLPGRMLLNSGARLSVLDSGFAQKAGLDFSGKASARIEGPGLKPVPVKVATVRKLLIGEALWENVEIPVGEVSQLMVSDGSGSGFSTEAGWLGASFLARTDAIIDYPRARVCFRIQ